MSSKLAFGLHLLLGLALAILGRSPRAALVPALLGVAVLFRPDDVLWGIFAAEAWLLGLVARGDREQPLRLHALLGLIFLGSVLAKCGLMHLWIHPGGEKLHYRAWLWTLISALGCCSWAWLVLRSRAWLGLVLLNLLLSVVAWADLLYYRYFEEVPGCYLLTQVSQAGWALPATLALIRPGDFLLLADLVLLGAILFKRGRPPLLVASRTSLALAGLGAVSFVFLSLVPLVRLVNLPNDSLGAGGRNIWVFKVLGLLNYHLEDVRQVALASLRRVFHWSDPSRTTLSNFDWQRWNGWLDASRASLEQPSPYRGRYAGCNLIYVQLESLQFFALQASLEGTPVMPWTQKFLRRCLWGSLQDQTGVGRSADGEFIALNSLLPCFGWPVNYSYPGNSYHGLPQALAHMGYTTCYTIDVASNYANSDILSRNNGFQQQYFQDRLGDHASTFRLGGTGLSDKVYFERLQPLIEQQSSPFYFHIITNSGHYPYREVSPSQRKLKVAPALAETPLRGFLESCARRDGHLQEIIERFEKTPLWRNTIFCFYGDHDGAIPDQELAEFLGLPAGPGLRVSSDQVAFFVHLPDEALKGPLPAGRWAQVDMVPTLAHLLGVKSQLLKTTGLNMLAPAPERRLLSQGGEGYALTGQQILLRSRGKFQGFGLQPPYPPQDIDPELLRQIHQDFKVVQDSFRLNVQKAAQSH